MTTLVAINTRDAIIMGSDSLGASTKQILDPNDLAEYFENNNGFKIKLGPDGRPLLDEWSKILHKAQTVPGHYYTHIEKIFSLAPLEMGVMCSGISTLGDRSLKNLFGEFSASESIIDLQSSDYTLNSVAERLSEFLWNHYSRTFTSEKLRPDLELMLCGYDKKQYTPGMVRIRVQDKTISAADYDFCIFFGGITKEIQRLVFGTDMFNKLRLIDRSRELLNRYHQLLTREMKSNKTPKWLKRPEEFGDELELFHDWRLDGLAASWGTLSEQAAIECIDFLINIMIHSQEFSTEIPSVGGEVQIALIKKNSGFQYISKREWRHGDYAVPRQS